MRKALLPLTILFTLGLRMKACVSIVLLFALVYASGCASVVHGTTQAVPVNSSPVGADVKVNCGKAASATGSLKTPTTVLLKRNAEPCNITVSREGYEDGSIVFVRKMSGWFWGNIFIGGIIGMIIDGADGAIYNRAPESASVSLAPLSSPTPRPESATPSTSLTPVTLAPPAPPAPTPAPASARAPAPAPSPTSRPAPPALAVGTMLFSKDGAPFGTVKLITRSAVSVSRVNGGIVTVTRDQAVSMQRVPRAEAATPESKPLAFSEVVVEGATKDQLYGAALAWLGDGFRSTKTVVGVQDKDAGRLVAKPSFAYAPKVSVGSARIKGTVTYAVTVEVKDGRYRYTIDGFTHEGTPGQGAASSFGLLTTDANCPYPVEGPTSAGKQETWENLKSLAKTEATTLTASLKKRMSDATKTTNDW